MSTRQAIDWQAVKARLRKSEAAIERSLTADKSRQERIFQERAQQLAARRGADANRSTAWPALVFRLGIERFCLPLSALVEVLPLVRCSPLPGANPELLGVINVRGEIRSVVDLARLLDLPLGENRAGGYVVLMRLAGVELGLRVDEVEKIEMVPPEAVTSLEVAATSQGASLAIGRTPARATILNADEIFSRVNT